MRCCPKEKSQCAGKQKSTAPKRERCSCSKRSMLNGSIKPEKQQQRRPRWRQPWGCCPYRSGPSSPRERARWRSRRTERRRAYGPCCRSGRRKRGRQPRYRMQGTAGAAAGSDGEVLLAVLDSPLLVGAGNQMLEAGGVGGVTGDGNLNSLSLHDGNAFQNVVGAVALNSSALAVGESLLANNLQLAGLEIVIGST